MLALLIWGVWGFLGKIVLNTLDWRVVYVMGGIGQLVVYLTFFCIERPVLTFGNGFYYTLIFGALGVLANIPFYQALSLGKASTVVPLTNLFPVVTVLLAVVVLKEQVTLTQGIGVVFAVIAVILISTGGN